MIELSKSDRLIVNLENYIKSFKSHQRLSKKEKYTRYYAKGMLRFLKTMQKKDNFSLLSK